MGGNLLIYRLLPLLLGGWAFCFTTYILSSTSNKLLYLFQEFDLNY